MTVTQYIGARYVPVFADPVEWTNQRNYEPLTIVLHEGNSFTSKQYVPVGIDIDDTRYWAETGNYNAQVEAYRQEVLSFDSRIDAVEADIAEINETVPSAVEENRFLFKTENPRFAPYTRFILEDSDIASMQVSTLTQDGNYWYVIVPTTDTDVNTLDSYLYCIDAHTDRVLSRTSLPVGHGRSLSQKGNKLLTSNQDVNTNNEYIVIDISSPVNPVLYMRGTFDGKHIFYTDDGAAYYDSPRNRLVFMDDNFTLTGETLTLPYGIRGEHQSYYYANGHYFIASTKPESIAILDKDGAIENIIMLDKTYGYVNRGECEAAFMINDSLYFSNNTIAAYAADGTPIREACLFRYDLDEPRSEWFNYRTNDLYMSGGGAANLYVDAVNGLLIGATGSSDKPFKFIEDCINSYYNAYVGNTGGVIANLSAYIRHDYPYSMNLSHAEISINGQNDDNQNPPTVSGIVCYYGKININNLLINRLVENGNKTQAMRMYNSEVRILNCGFETATPSAIQVSEASICNIANSKSGLEPNVQVVRSTLVHDGLTRVTLNKGIALHNGIFNLSASVQSFDAGFSDASNGFWFRITDTNNVQHQLYLTTTGIRRVDGGQTTWEIRA